MTEPTENQYHFFASCIFGWATAPSREEAIDKLAEGFRFNLKPCIKAGHKDGLPGAYVWSCRVEAPETARYHIVDYRPQGVGRAMSRASYITHLTRNNVAIYHVNQR